MPRLVRIARPGLVHHIIARVVNGEFRIDSSGRRDYLRRLAIVLDRTEWRLLGYAIMSNHIHIAALAGAHASARLIQPLHTGFALWSNLRQDRSGPMFAGRHTTYAYGDDAVGGLLAYLHNNPVRAGVVANAEASDWTSHRALAGIDECPRYLCRDLAYSIMRLEPAEFVEVVRRRGGEPRDPALSASRTAATATRARKSATAPVDLGSPRAASDGTGMVYPILARAGVRPRRGFEGDATQVVDLVALHVGVGARWIRGRARWREAVRGRRLALLVWRELGRPLVEMTAALGLSSGAGSHLLRGVDACEALAPAVADLVERVRATTENDGASGGN